jgi:DNA helicase HerA-like ATPase
MDYEELGSFYLGRIWDPESAKIRDELLLYDSKDLTTHALCVGMTGSGKTGLCVSLLEEAAIDGIPALVIDPKGDLGNLCLNFPQLRPDDFEPWIDPAQATRRGETVPEAARRTAQLWRNGLAEWGQGPDRLERLAKAAEVAIYTPGSRAGRPLRVLPSLDAPPPALRDDADALGDRISATVSGLLALLDLDADPISSREHILLSNLLERAWRQGESVDFAGLVARIQSPPFERLGVLDLESFFPARERQALALRLNGLLASPGFAAWLEGEPLDIARLLRAPDGRPRIAVLSIAHLGDRERMFFVSQLLNEVIAWMRGQAGSSSLRALIYMDEIYGYFPPVANPPSKAPMLTLLKQARAFGVGVVLSTQNPADLDYKGLSNCGTWFLGRLQTERDKARVLDGLEGASVANGAAFERSRMDRLLSGLGKRVFLMSNVHDERPELFHTRWALSYLAGPLTREQIKRLALEKSASEPGPPATKPPPEPLAGPAAAAADRPLLPPGVTERFLAPRVGATGDVFVHRPALLAQARLHYANASAGVDHWEERTLLSPLREPIGSNPWEGAEPLAAAPVLALEPAVGGKFASLPTLAAREKSYASWRKRLAGDLYRNEPLVLYRHRKLRQTSRPGQSEADFRAELRHALRERRDLAVEKLRKRYTPKLARLEDRIRQAERRAEVQREQHRETKMSAAVSLGATVLGALFGRRARSVGTVGRAATTARRAGRIGREKADVSRAEERVEELSQQLRDLSAEFEEAAAELAHPIDPSEIELEEKILRPRKSDIEVEPLVLVWAPWSVSPQGIAEPAY